MNLESATRGFTGKERDAETGLRIEGQATNFAGRGGPVAAGGDMRPQAGSQAHRPAENGARSGHLTTEISSLSPNSPLRYKRKHRDSVR